MSETMQVVEFVGPGQARWQEAPTPRLEGAEQALVRPTAVTACGLDIHMIEGRVPVDGGFVLGHEFLADVLEVGETVTSVRPGDRVLVPFQISCGRCRFCRLGRTASCTGVVNHAMFGLAPFCGHDHGGGLSDVVRVPFADAMCVAVPADVPASIASVGDNTSDAWRCIGPYVGDGSDTPVLVVGAGTRAGFVAVAAVAIARALGSPVEYVDETPRNLALAERLGATVVEGLPSSARDAFPLTVSVGATADCLSYALRSTEPGGVCVNTAIFWGNATPVPLLEMYDTGITLVTGRAHVRAAMPAVVELIRSGRLDVDMLVESRAPWAEADAAMSNVSDKLLISR
jgi:threonine dehydrogenase-like Zn-dependent dehydrogenase